MACAWTFHLLSFIHSPAPNTSVRGAGEQRRWGPAIASHHHGARNAAYFHSDRESISASSPLAGLLLLAFRRAASSRFMTDGANSWTCTSSGPAPRGLQCTTPRGSAALRSAGRGGPRGAGGGLH